jgi:hypothetical protein
MVMNRRSFMRTLAGAALPIKLPPITRKRDIDSMPGPPRGVYVVAPVTDPQLANQRCWHQDCIKGVLLRTQWQDVAPTPTDLDLSFFDQGLALANRYGKQCMLGIAFGLNSPSWVYQYATPWVFDSGPGGTMPAPWDTGAQALISNVIQTMSGKYARHPQVSGISTWCGGNRTEECFFAQSTNDLNNLNALGGPTLWTGAAKFYLSKWRAYFPGTQLYCVSGNAIATPGNTVAAMNDVATYALGLGYGLEYNGLVYKAGAGSPKFNPSLGYIPMPFTTINTATVEAGYQFLDPIENAIMNGATIAQTLGQGQAANGKFIQIYPNDASFDPEEASIIAFNNWSGAN